MRKYRYFVTAMNMMSWWMTNFDLPASIPITSNNIDVCRKRVVAAVGEDAGKVEFALFFLESKIMGVDNTPLPGALKLAVDINTLLGL